MVEHRWSGWPGAWCFDCGSEDKTEICLADHDIILYCQNGHWLPECPEGCPSIPIQCQEHINQECPEPGSNRHNPYSSLPA